ncbi:hypothetical protein CPB83DRAFT_865258 [Crepidotus variabilis]|uniref:SPIN90/Ldb17 leucine-rich domain-containing protein n=1 Tax=Crepidotus variabilis TaxID=179855 RepID=A0A9P6JHW2_9AGAR|nr:hypothetical protein CPB83DRAFT_865258 [Crepidotus variabilis]
MVHLAHGTSGTATLLTMQDDMGITYLIESAQQFWSELEDTLTFPQNEAPTLSVLDSTLRRFVTLCSTYHEQYLQSPLQLEHAIGLLLDSELFQFHSERMCEIIVEDAQSTTDPHLLFIFYVVLYFHGNRRADFFRSHKRWQPLLPYLMDHVLVEMDPDAEDIYLGTAVGKSTSFNSVPIPIEAKLRTLSVKLLYDVCKVQTLSVQDLKIFDDDFIDYLYDLVEQTKYMQDESFNYSVIKLIIALNEQFMVAGLSHDEPRIGHPKDPPEHKNRVIRVLMRRLGSSKTFGENMIFMLNRAQHSPEDFCMKLLILKILYVLFSTKGTAEYFYTNDLCVLVDVFLRELADMEDDSESLRHTYLRVLHPLLTKTQLREVPYKRAQILVALESMVGHTKMREITPTTRRLVERCLSGEWCIQLTDNRHDATIRVSSPTSDQSSVLSPPATHGHLSMASAQQMPPASSSTSGGGNILMKNLKFSKSVEHLSGRAADHHKAKQPVRLPMLDQLTRPNNASVSSLPTLAAISTSKPIAAPRPSKKRSTSAAADTSQSPRQTHGSLPPSSTMPVRDVGQDVLAPPFVPNSRSPLSPISPSPSIASVRSDDTSSTSSSSGSSKTHRRPPPPPPKRRKPPAIPTTNGMVTMTTIRSSEPSPLSKVHKPIGLSSISYVS